MTNEERGGGAADGCANAGQEMRPATELERMGDRLARSEHRCAEALQRLDTTERVLNLTLDELDLARRKQPAPADVEELIEALRDACALVASLVDVHPKARDAAVARWIRTIDKARGRLGAMAVAGRKLEPADAREIYGRGPIGGKSGWEAP